MIQIMKVCGRAQERAFFTGPPKNHDGDNSGLRRPSFLMVEFD